MAEVARLIGRAVRGEEAPERIRISVAELAGRFPVLQYSFDTERA